MPKRLVFSIKMRAILLVGLALLASCVASPLTPQAEPQLYYHDAVGFQLAAKIKATEEALMKELLDNAIRGEPIEVPITSRIVGGAAAPTDTYPFLVRFVEMDQHCNCVEIVIPE